MLLQFANLWKDLAQFDDDNVNSFQQFGHYTTLLQPKLRLLSIMTNYMFVLFTIRYTFTPITFDGIIRYVEVWTFIVNQKKYNKQ